MSRAARVPVIRQAARRFAAIAAGAAVTAIAMVGCDAGRLVTLGEKTPAAPRFDPPRLIVELNSGEKNDNPTLTGDLLEIYFTSERATGNGDVWTAQRPSASDPFGPTQRVEAVSDPAAFESSSAIALDGLTLWFGSDRPGGAGDLDIWVSTRGSRGAAWSPPVNLSVLNSAARDIPRPPGGGGLVMPIGSTRPAGDLYHTFFSSRTGSDAPFGAPTPIPELVFPDRATVDGFLTDDGLALYYSSSELTRPSDLYVARRATTADPFTVIQPLADLNSSADDRDPWLSPDGTRFFFSSDRGGTLSLYEAVVRPP